MAGISQMGDESAMLPHNFENVVIGIAHHDEPSGAPTLGHASSTLNKDGKRRSSPVQLRPRDDAP
jgi:hypothetical protein